MVCKLIFYGGFLGPWRLVSLTNVPMESLLKYKIDLTSINAFTTYSTKKPVEITVHRIEPTDPCF